MVERCGYRRESEISNANHSSFSSSLLDAIYRSIDQGDGEMVMYGEGARKKSYGVDGGSVRRGGVFKSDEEMANFQRACMIEKWMEKKAGEKSGGRRNSAADLQVKKPRKDRESSSWSSSDSSCGGGGASFFSSSEAESFQMQRPKPIRTGYDNDRAGGIRRDSEFSRRESEQKPKIEGGFSKTKLRALKIYGDLKKVKQPISPGGKLAGFLNSLFPGGNMKKNRVNDDSPSLKSTSASTCSSASSFSRSCLSKTPSSRGKPSAGAKRSVRFSPVSVILDDDLQPCGHKSLHSAINTTTNTKQTSNFDSANNHTSINTIRTVINEELMAHMREKNRRVEEAARDLLRNYQRKNQSGYEHELQFDHFRKPHVKNNDFDEEDDAASCASSDLFELDNLSAIGMERYNEELPVYESTRIDSGSGLIF